MEASTATARRPRRVRGDLSQDIAKYALIGLLLLMPVAFGIHDLSHDGNLTRLAINIKDGLSNGAILALIAIGYTLVYGIIELINFAHGDVFMIGTFISFGFFGSIGLTDSTATIATIFGLIATLLLAMFACGSLNTMIERVAYRPLRGAPKLAPLITAVGMSFILRNVGLLWLGGQHRSVPDILGSQEHLFTVGGVTFTNGDVFAWLVTAPL